MNCVMRATLITGIVAISCLAFVTSRNVDTDEYLSDVDRPSLRSHSDSEPVDGTYLYSYRRTQEDRELPKHSRKFPEDVLQRTRRVLTDDDSSRFRNPSEGDDEGVPRRSRKVHGVDDEEPPQSRISDSEDKNINQHTQKVHSDEAVDIHYDPRKVYSEHEKGSLSSRNTYRRKGSSSGRRRVSGEENVTNRSPQEEEELDDSFAEGEDIDPETKELLDIARQHAIQVIVEKMLIAFGPDFIEESRGAPKNDTLPTVASPLNITTEPCPEIYTKCSSEMFLSSCKPPKHSHKGLWKQRFNLYFDLPPNLLKDDELLSAKLRIYKHSPLPLTVPTTLIIEIYAYTRSLTLKRDWNILINSTNVLSDFVGWISMDLTDLIRNFDPKKNHGFLIKVRDINGILWNAPELFVPMNCSESNKSLVPVPFGVMTEEPEQKFPSLTIHTGMFDHYYSEFHDEERNSEYDVSDAERGDKDFEYEVPPSEYEEYQEEKDMSGDDPLVHDAQVPHHDRSLTSAEDVGRVSESDMYIPKHRRRHTSLHNHPHHSLVQKPIREHNRRSEKENNFGSSFISSLEDEFSTSSARQWKKSDINSFPDIYESRIIITRKQQRPQKRHQSLSAEVPPSFTSHAHSEDSESLRLHHRHHRHETKDSELHPKS